jgi:hypothetical protein
VEIFPPILRDKRGPTLVLIGLFICYAYVPIEGMWIYEFEAFLEFQAKICKYNRTRVGQKCTALGAFFTQQAW